MKNKYKNVCEAKDRISRVEKELEEILSEELVGVNKVEQTVGVWLEIFGDHELKQDLKQKLLAMEDEMISAHLYLRHLSTRYDVNNDVRLLDTFH